MFNIGDKVTHGENKRVYTVTSISFERGPARPILVVQDDLNRGFTQFWASECKLYHSKPMNSYITW